MKEADNIELRSDKVRNIIGQIPPSLIRIGSSTIFMFFVGVFLFLYFYEYEQMFNVPALIKRHNSSYEINLFVPRSFKGFVAEGNPVYLMLGDAADADDIQVRTQIEKVPDVIEFTGGDSFYRYVITMDKESLLSENKINLNIKDSIRANAEISTSPTTLLKWLFR